MLISSGNSQNKHKNRSLSTISRDEMGYRWIGLDSASAGEEFLRIIKATYQLLFV
jgi:hypothetical protein